MMKHIKIAALVVAMGLSAGCYTMGREYNDASVSEVKVGVTTESELITKFGQPDYTTVNSDGSKVLTWSYVAGSNFIVASDSRSKSFEATVYGGKVTNTRTTKSADFDEKNK